ncbi:MAG: mechanosensitive ion channel family protein [Hyphomonadaceae bacterium]
MSGPASPAGVPHFATAWTDAGREAAAYFSRLSIQDLALNAGLSVLLMALAGVASWIFSRALRLALRRLARVLRLPDGRQRSAATRAVKLTGHAAIWLVGASLVVGLWGVDAAGWAAGPGAPFLAFTFRIVIIVLGAAVIWEAAIAAMERLLSTMAARADTARRAAQLRSLAPMSRSAIRSLVGVFAAMLIVSELGVKIGPLLAGAGVVGIAVGFGAQTLVKDYLTGFSLILEDIVSVGDIVRIGQSGGLVETMTLRTIRLRDFDGTLHVIPYSEAQTVHNLTKTFSYYVFDLPISYDSDIDRALALMREVGAELQCEAPFRDKILEPIEVVGVDSLADSAVVLKARIKTAPIQQWSVGREYNRRIKIAFDRAGIEIPAPRLKLLLSERALAAVKAS